MALPKYALGREERLFIVPESTYGAAASAPAGGNAIRFKSLSLEEKEDRVQREDKRATRSYLATIVRRQSVNWSVSGYLLPSGAAGTKPDGWDDLLAAGFGTQTVNASTSVVYTLAKEFESTVTLHRAVGNAAATSIFSEMARGCVVDKVSFSLSATDEAMITCSGFGADILRAGHSLAATSGTVTTMDVTTGDGPKFDVGSYIDVGADTGILISAISTDTLTIPSTAILTGETVAPTACTVAQTFVSTAVPISGILGSCSLEGSSLEIISANIDLDNLAKAHNDKYGAAKTTSYHLGNRRVTGSIQMRLHQENFLTLAKTRRSTTVALSLISGTAAGSIATFSLPAIQIDYTAIPSTPVDDILVTLPFIAYGSSGEDEISLTLT